MNKRRGFTLVELLVVIGIIAILIAVLLPVLLKIREHGYRTTCLSNVRQLTVAWANFVTEHNGTLPLDVKNPWVLQERSEYAIQNGSLFPYLRNMKVYRCPNDPREQALRSYCINYYLYGLYGGGLNIVGPTNITEVKQPGEVIAFIENGGWDVSSGCFWVPILPPASWETVPSYWHGGSPVSFVDGHAEFLKWEDPRTLELWKSWGGSIAQPDNRDLLRLRALLIPELKDVK